MRPWSLGGQLKTWRAIVAFERAFNNFPAGWRAIVNRWGELNNRYYEDNEDLPAWYVENSNSALLSAAAWMQGCPAICEMDVEKRSYTGERGRPRTYAGRMDMEVTVGDTTYWIEAKRRDFALSEQSNYSFRHSFLTAAIGDAIENARQCRHNANDFNAEMMSIVFFSGRIDPDAPERRGAGAPERRRNMVTNEIEKLLENMTNYRRERRESAGVIFYAVFRRVDFDIPRGWTDYPWPAAFGICAVIDD